MSHPRGQRFVLSERGGATVRDYLAEIVQSRTIGGRAALDEARTRWAARHGLQPEDGLSLAEFDGGPLTLSQLVDRLDGLGPTPKSLRLDVDRLVERGYLIPAASAA